MSAGPDALLTSPLTPSTPERRPPLTDRAIVPPVLPRRPAPWLGLLLDSALAAVAYLAAHHLLFALGFDSGVGTSAQGLWATVAAQVTALVLLQAYARRSRIDWLLRVTAGILAGTAVAGVLITVMSGDEHVSAAFLIDGGMLTASAILWRALWVAAQRVHARSRSLDADSALIDRSAEMMTLRGVIHSLYKYRELLKNLVLKDVKLKYRGSVFGFLWSLANPLLMMVVYATAFTFILRIRTEGFVFYLMLGQLSWTFFAGAASMSTGAVIDNSGLLKSVLFPRAILPIATVLFNLVQFLLTLSVFLPAMMLWYDVPLRAPMALFPIFIALQLLFTIGVALILATATAFFRDVRHLLEVSLSVLFWTTPIVYELSHVPERMQPLILLSPVASFVIAYQQMFVYRVWPDPSVWLVASAYSIGAFVIGALLFLTFEDRFTEQL